MMEWQSMDSFCGSTFWDANQTWFTDEPELSECLEKTVLIWIPAAFFWLFFPLDIYLTLSNRAAPISWNPLNSAKVVTNGLLICLVIFEFGHNTGRIDDAYPVIYWTPFILITTYGGCLMLTVIHMKKGQVSSGLMLLFWALNVFLGAHLFRSDIRSFINQVSTGVNVSSITSYVLKIVMLALHMFADRAAPDALSKEQMNKVLPLKHASALSRFTMSWYDKMAFLGFRRPLVMSDLWDLEKEMSSSYLVTKFDLYWSRAVKKHKSSGKKGVVSAFWPSFRGFLQDYILCNILRLIAELLGFASPLLLKLMLRFVKNKDENSWKGLFLAVVMVLCSLVQSCLASNSQLLLYHFGIKAKSALVGAVFKKSLRLSNKAKSECSFGEVVNIMSIDCEKIMECIYFIQLMWLAPLQIIITFILLWQMMGPAVIAGFSIMFVLLPVNWLFSRKIHSIQTKQMATKDTRIKSMNEILSGIKVIKLNAWEPTFEGRVSAFRGREVKFIKQMAYLSSTMSCFWSCATCFMLLSTFAVFVLSDENNVLDVETAFTSIALFNILYITLFMIPHFINYISQARVSWERINRFMNIEEIDSTAVNHSKESGQLTMEKCSLSWDDDNRPALKDIDIQISRGALVAVVGPVGSGKSSLISGFLGDMNRIKGRINTQGSIAYVPQVAWIQNDTVRGNILFGHSYSASKYKKVIKACALVDDFDMLPAGDLTEIGEKGINLSGGQKQRVSLARAVYADADVYLLDDPLSAVDSLVGRHIFQHLIGPKGLLKLKTRVLVTHLVSCLPEVDQVIVLKDGTVSALGTYHDLMTGDSLFREFILNYSQEQNSPPQTTRDNNSKELDHSLDTTPLLKKGILKRQESTDGRKSLSSFGSEDLITKGDKKGDLVEVEHTETGQVNLNVLVNYIKAMGVKWWCFIVLFCFIRQSFNIGGNYWISLWSNDPSLTPVNASANTSKRDMYLGVYGSIIFCQAMGSYLSELIPLIACLKAAVFLHNSLLKAMLKAPLSFFDTTPLGRIISRFSKDVDALDTNLPLALTQSIVLMFELIGIVFVISVSSPIFLIVLIPIAIVYYFIRKFYILSSTQLRRLVSVTRSPIFSHFSETLTGIHVIRAFGQEERFINESYNRVDSHVKAFYTATVANRWLSVRLETLGNLVIFFAAMSAVLTRDTMSAGIIGMSLTYSLMITRNLLLLMRWSAESELHIVAAERIKEYCDIQQEKSWELSSTVADDWPQKGEVIFKDFTFRYREGLDPVLKSVTFTINPGEKVGIVGRSGAGKSSLTLSLFRIVESAGGALYIDGVDISTLGLHRLRRSLNIISQDPVLFSGSLRLNLDPESKYSDEELWNSLEMAHLKSFVSSLEEGLAYDINEGGSNLSVGQRQQMCLARALLNRAKILVMDEATASIDLETDDLIQTAIRKHFSSCTVLTIAHRINTIMDSDRVLVMDSGAVAEFDSPSNLLAKPDSLFSALAHQAGID